MDSICSELGIPRNHVVEAGGPCKDRFLVVVHKSWLKCLEERKKLTDFPTHPDFDKRISSPLGHSWMKIYMQIYKKHNHKVIPLPRKKSERNDSDYHPLTYSQILNYVANNNHKNLWQAAYEKHQETYQKFFGHSGGGKIKDKRQHDSSINLVPYDIVLRELIQRMFGCCIIHAKLDKLRCPTDPALIQTDAIDIHENILPAVAAIETSSYFTVVFSGPALEHSLYDCVTYSQAILRKSCNKPLFIVYQLLHFVTHIHDLGLLMGEITLHDILLRENLWLQIIPNLQSNLTKLESQDSSDDHAVEPTKFDLKFAYDLQQFTLREYSEMWCNGQLSNFDYLTILNNISGRKIGVAGYHHIMPWVTDFSQRNGMNWRDLSKSKYRLNKGDAHLDLMFNTSTCNDTPHHVSEFLSEITYFVYMARRTPQHVLCQHVRPIWVPAEYPASIQRLQQWTPDECIPEFYSDPMIFKSVHEDLADLELPLWASCPEDFIAKHREALESQHVSEKLNHWIDLNFGYKLSGQAAIKSKNVCLSLVDNHTTICKKGIVQLFSHPHPPRRFPSIWFSKTPPRISASDHKRRLTRSSEDLPTSTSLYLSEPHNTRESRRLASSPKTQFQRSSPNIPEDAITSVNIERSPSYHTSVQQKGTNTIHLPKDFSPCSQLQALENMEIFFAKSFLNQKTSEKNRGEKLTNNDLQFDNSIDNSYTNLMFSQTYEAKLEKDDKRLHNKKHKNLLVQNTTKNFKQILANKFSRELQVVGCIIVELFLMHKIRVLVNSEDSLSFEKRFDACRTVAKNYYQELPKCVQESVKSFLKLNDYNEILTELGLPQVTAHQAMQPILSNFFLPFPISYVGIYACVRTLNNFDVALSQLLLSTYFECDGKQCSKFDDLDRKRVVYSRKIAECKVKACYLHIDRLLEASGYEQFTAIELLLPHILDLLNAEETSILAAWYIFDHVAIALGIKDTQKYLLQPILKLFDSEVDERSLSNPNSMNSSIKFTTSSSFKSRKSVKLYHHIFLLRLMVRFGLKCFLETFVPALIEAVGGYKEPEETTGFHYHTNRYSDFRRSRSARHLKFCCNDESENSMTLISPDLSEMKSDRTISPDTNTRQDVEDVFAFEPEQDENFTSLDYEPKSLDNLSLCHSNAEEATEDALTFSAEKLAINDIIYGYQKSSTTDDDKLSLNSQTESPKHVSSENTIGPKSPTIRIPSAFRRSYELSTIDCEIGSKKSVDSVDLLPRKDEKEREAIFSANILKTATQNSNIEADDSLQASVISKMSETRNSKNNRISEMSTESIIWLSHRLGPMLTAKFLTRNLLKMLTLCYVGQENLLPDNLDNVEETNLNCFTIADSHVIGDQNAIRVLDCLTSVAALFGEQFVLLQYFPHVSELISLCKKRITTSLEGALISSLQLLKYLIPCLMDSTIMDQLQDTILRVIIHPIIRLLGSSSCLMPNGFLSRSVLARKLLDAIYVLAVRIGPEMSKEHLCVPALQRFFLIFDKAHGIGKNLADCRSGEKFRGSNFLEIRRDGTMKEWNIHGSQILRVQSFADLSSDENDVPSSAENLDSHTRERALEEIRDVFTPNLAHCAYLAFLKYLGESIMSKTVVNLELILTLCHEYERPDYSAKDRNKRVEFSDGGKVLKTEEEAAGSNSFGTSVTGNRIEVVDKQEKHEMGPMEVLDMVAYKFEQINITRHLRGNWLAYWEHEIGRSDKDNHFNLKQIKLQTFAGHTNSVRSILTLDNENSFMSASKDKTVKLWSLRSEGDGKKVSSCQYVYNCHKKSVHSLAFLESMRLAVSCDSGVHLWDPFVGSNIAQLETNSKNSPVSVVRTYPSPSRLVLAGTADSTVRIIDGRTASYVNEWKVTLTQNSTVRCLACSPSGTWIAVGLSSGYIITLDGRTGVVMGSWKATDGELLQLIAPNDQQIISSSLDHSISVWNALDNGLQIILKQPPEPAHCLQLNGNELIFATPANRIGVYSNCSNSDGQYAMTKLRSETLKGVLTSFSVLPLNRLLLAGSDSGNIVLLC